MAHQLIPFLLKEHKAFCKVKKSNLDNASAENASSTKKSSIPVLVSQNSNVTDLPIVENPLAINEESDQLETLPTSEETQGYYHIIYYFLFFNKLVCS